MTDLSFIRRVLLLLALVHAEPMEADASLVYAADSVRLITPPTELLDPDECLPKTLGLTTRSVASRGHSRVSFPIVLGNATSFPGQHTTLCRTGIVKRHTVLRL